MKNLKELGKWWRKRNNFGNELHTKTMVDEFKSLIESRIKELEKETKQLEDEVKSHLKYLLRRNKDAHVGWSCIKNNAEYALFKLAKIQELERLSGDG